MDGEGYGARFSGGVAMVARRADCRVASFKGSGLWIRDVPDYQKGLREEMENG
jgi:hypothetical protein